MILPNPLLEKQPQTFTLIGCFTVRTTFSFPGRFQTKPFTEFSRMVVSSEKITLLQSLRWWFRAHFNRFCRCVSLSNGFDKGRLNFAPASVRRRCTVLPLITTPFFLNRFAISSVVINVSESTRETICWSCFAVVARVRPDWGKSLKSFDVSTNIWRSKRYIWSLWPQLNCWVVDRVDVAIKTRFHIFDVLVNSYLDDVFELMVNNNTNRRTQIFDTVYGHTLTPTIHIYYPIKKFLIV